MSIIYSAGQYDDAFSPKRLGNWEKGAKEIYPSSNKFYSGPGAKTKIIVDEKGHLLPGVARNKSTTWGLLQYYMHTKSKSNMAMMSGPGKVRDSTVEKRIKKLPRYIPKKPTECSLAQDRLMEYLKELGLPIVWIIGPPTKGIFHKRRQFSKQLATSLGFGYVNLDEKIQEWKDRQSSCTCSNQLKSQGSSSSITCGASEHTLASTSIAPSKLPTSIPPRMSANLRSPPGSTTPVVISMFDLMDCQRITFDSALPIERNKMLELYKFAMAECLPCEGFVCESVPFDLVEGLAFEKIFYPAALAIYFAEGIPQRKQSTDRLPPTEKEKEDPRQNKKAHLDFLDRSKKPSSNGPVYLRAKSHKRLGSFNVSEGEKICRQYGSKTIRIINAEEVERDTMDFLNELVKKNLEKYPQILEGNVKLDCSMAGCGRSYFRQESPPPNVRQEPPESASSSSTKFSYSSSFITMESVEDDDYKKSAKSANKATSPLIPSGLEDFSDRETSILVPPKTFQDRSRPPSPFEPSTSSTAGTKGGIMPDQGGAGDHVVEGETSRKKSLYDKINKLENKVKNLSPTVSRIKEYNSGESSHRLPIPPPTAYADESENEEQTLTSVIRKAIARQFQQRHQPRQQENYEECDYGASGDFGKEDKSKLAEDEDYDIYYDDDEPFPLIESDSDVYEEKKKKGDSNEDPFYDS